MPESVFIRFHSACRLHHFRCSAGWRNTSVLDLLAFILGVAIGIMEVAIITTTTITTFIIILTVILLTGTAIAIMAAVMAIMAVVRCRPFKSFSPHACPVRYAAGSAG